MQIMANDLYNPDKTIAGELIRRVTYPWEMLPLIGEYIKRLGKTLPEDEYEQVGAYVWIARDATVTPTAYIGGPAIIDRQAQIRHCAYIRGNAIVGKRAVVGNSTELKNVILFDDVQVPHYNYVGDSVLGHGAHMGAGAITSNVRSDKKEVIIHAPDRDIRTGLKKCGAFLADRTEVGCQAVLNPGSVVGKDAVIYPLCMVRGCILPGHICKSEGRIQKRVEKYTDLL